MNVTNINESIVKNIFPEQLAQRFGVTAGKIISDGIGELWDFPHNAVRLRFEDGSEAEFNHAFHLVDKEKKLIGVFTEHCGYHLFHLPGTKVKVRRITKGWRE